MTTFRPTCIMLDCNRPSAMISQNKNTGHINWRKYCSQCHNTRTAALHGLKNILEITASRAGKTVTELLNSRHRYRKYREDYCENQDGRLGFHCTTSIIWDGMLDVDHKDEDPTNNRPENLQTLCKCCHAYKTNMFFKANGRTPGRKTLGVTY